MTTATLKTFAKNYDRNFILLLEDWGRWERTAAKVQGWGKGRSDPPHFVDDKTAMIINECAGKIKSHSPGLFEILRWRYIQDLDDEEIFFLLKKRLKGDKNARYLRISLVDVTVEKVSRLLYEELRGVM
ncbi:MAG: hypothetical protein Q4E81_03520 [Succinatimonas sp.]|nr:hypothetical protein [Succinatimonas sp.]